MPKPEASVDEKRESVDWIGFIISVLALGTLIYGLMNGENIGWGSGIIIGCFIASFALWSLFYVHAGHWTKRGGTPILPFSIFNNANFTGGCVLYAIIQGGFMSTVFLTIEFQHVFGFTPLQAGLASLPIVIPYVLVGKTVGKLFDRHGARRLIILGLVLISAGAFAIAALLPRIHYIWVLPGLILFGAGFPFVTTPTITSALASVEDARRGVASAALNSIRQVGGCLGIAIMGSIIQSINLSHVKTFLTARQSDYPTITAALSEKLLAGSQQAIRQLHSLSDVAIHHLYRVLEQAYTVAVSKSIYGVAILILLSIALSFCFPRKHHEA